MKKVEIEFNDLKRIKRALNDACEVIRSKYPSANHLERKGMKMMMDELHEAEEICWEIIREQNQLEMSQEHNQIEVDDGNE